MRAAGSPETVANIYETRQRQNLDRNVKEACHGIYDENGGLWYSWQATRGMSWYLG
jgi:hypothetical protein